MKNRKGFTTVELVIVIAVIAILATVLIPTFSNLIGQANDSKALQEAKNAHTNYLIENGGTAPEYMLYDAGGRFVALHNGAPKGVYATHKEALKTMLDDPDTALTDESSNYTIQAATADGLFCVVQAIVESKQLFIAANTTKNYYLDSKGSETYCATASSGTWHITDYIQVDSLNAFGYSNLNTSGNAPHSAFYDSDKNLVSIFKQKQGVETLEIPNGAAYVRFSVLQTNGLFNFHFWRNGPEQLFVKENATKGFYLNVDGTTTDSAVGSTIWHITDYMPVDSTSAFFYTILGNAGNAPKTVFYDAEKNVVGSYQQVQGENIPLEIPDGAAYVRFSILQVDGNFSFYFLRFESAYSICINGDSIETESAGLWSKMLRDNVIFSGYKNIAVGGTRIKGQINSDDRVNQIPVNTDILITAGGTNDWAQDIPLGSLDTLDDPETFYGAVHLYIQKVRDKFPDMIIVMASNPFGCCPGRFTESKDVAGGVYNNINLSIADYTKVIKEVAEFNNVYYIPVYEECGISQANYEQYNLSEYNNYGHHVFLHPNSDGASKILNVYLKYLADIERGMQ